MVEAEIQIPENYDYPTPGHLIIWLDTHIGRPNECKKLKEAFASNMDPRNQTWTMLTDPDYDNLLRSNEARPVHFAGVPFLLLAFDDLTRCYESFEQNKDKHIYFITSGTMGKDIIPRLIANYEQLFKDPITNNSYYSIYIFCGNTEYHLDWLYEVRGYVQVFNHEADLLARMTRDVADYFVEQGRHCLQNALLRYKWSKKLFTQYSKMGEICRQNMQDVEKMMADIEKILQPHISNPHVDGNNLNENNYNDDDDNDERPSEPCS
ncbi:unnamed protein product [Rotaria sp. Silwood1]|nr:unnamed protein product [Rotaria sp. Silwood1]CAF3457015.1 unnamed protein product [Rotaria sp. Silwood1]CAF4895237.1 unnamed protein product [Rotaria sp. Silwood1]